ncbi:cytochrome oxidase small assembly protein [Aquabacterium lacunae]|jgi:hypothetical protein|uniref:cytochrome oxidase small assembly protein n=1 Tax=Aquabacterium lacunae TaxID=2528630 RepID=UPI0013EF0A15
MSAPASPSVSPQSPSTPDMRQRNVRLGLILASVAGVFFLGFIARIALLSGA